MPKNILLEIEKQIAEKITWIKFFLCYNTFSYRRNMIFYYLLIVSAVARMFLLFLTGIPSINMRLFIQFSLEGLISTKFLSDTESANWLIYLW